MVKVVDIKPRNPADDPDTVLERAKGQYQNVVVIGYGLDGELDVRGDTKTSHESILFMVELFKHKLLNGDYSDE